MNSTRQLSQNPPIKPEDGPGDEIGSDSTHTAVNNPRKRAREGPSDGDTTSALSVRVKNEEIIDPNQEVDVLPPRTHADYKRLRLLYRESLLMREAISEEKNRLVAELRRTRRELHNLRGMVTFVGLKLQDEAARRFRGIDSDTASEDELEDSISDEEF
ncbi:hypothetical protein B0H19DRAFT_1246532 [Mycena capillaripes]|nr:hypothetical protein B0H19DRAFT_1246532 [Mycena capillaripes]